MPQRNQRKIVNASLLLRPVTTADIGMHARIHDFLTVTLVGLIDTNRIERKCASNFVRRSIVHASLYFGRYRQFRRPIEMQSGTADRGDRIKNAHEGNT
ncbi:hypothetical protein WS70_21270 [Burkholderia mayonis]|uniref:Uncharacterized protein n=1 Tax=Burkholderia mayonis TaxID=1385591 RepID=A0A1B4FL32_9BURK|nr:hypothetical protein WS70_21270 [Burkholderia mayonis]KVE40278.1 hypothetical protein WS70_18030 [Burkholderia mayonis]